MDMKFGKCQPFPKQPGIYNRYVLTDSAEKKGAVVIVQGQVLLFAGEEVTVMDQGAATKAQIIMEGDLRCQKEGCTVVYVPILGIGLKKKDEGVGKPGGIISGE